MPIQLMEEVPADQAWRMLTWDCSVINAHDRCQTGSHGNLPLLCLNRRIFIKLEPLHSWKHLIHFAWKEIFKRKKRKVNHHSHPHQVAPLSWDEQTNNKDGLGSQRALSLTQLFSSPFDRPRLCSARKKQQCMRRMWEPNHNCRQVPQNLNINLSCPCLGTSMFVPKMRTLFVCWKSRLL